MTEFVALDLETTGLTSSDEIIEIGAVRFTEKRVEGEFQTLVRPRTKISGFVSRLTGITPEMVQNAPAVEEVLPRLREFIGNAVIIGHNIGFDLRFLERAGYPLFNYVADTYEMASVLMPTASRYGLGALGSALGIPLPATHRALDDARVTHRLYLRLWEMALELPIEILAKIVNLGDQAKEDWLGFWPFQQAMLTLQRQGVRARGGFSLKFRDTASAQAAKREISPKAEKPVFADEVSDLLEPDGALASTLAEFEYRPQQVEMARAVAESLSNSEHLLVEAGTGTGKSIAYLLPAAIFALKNNTRVVISTNTKNLQDQLLQKDIPTVQAALGEELVVAVLKGRSNYLCPHRFSRMLERRGHSAAEVRVLAKVMVWLHQGASGDRAELNLRGREENFVWSRISADAPSCTARACEMYTHSTCPFRAARNLAEHAHLIVVNHALLLTDASTEGEILPEYKYLIADEAHHLESAATSALSTDITQDDLRRLFNELGGTTSGLLGKLLKALTGLPAAQMAAVRSAAEEITDKAFRLQNALNLLFSAVDDFLEDEREGRPLGAYAHQVRITPAVRHSPFWDGVEVIWDEAWRTYQALDSNLSALLRNIYDEALQYLGDESTSASDLAVELSNLAFQLKETLSALNALIAEPQAGMIYWVQIQPQGRRVSLHSAPLEIGGQMRNRFWNQKEAIILTSATLTTGGDFDYLRVRLGVDEAREMVLGSPFDYKNAALLYVVNDIPEPNRKQEFQRAVEKAILELARATHGRLMALFTSYAQLQRTAEAIREPLLAEGIMVYEQGGGASPQALLDEFRTSDGAVLLGTRAFWEGVDIPGEALSALVIVKLPFAVPSDPIVAARSEMFENPFRDYQLPEAVLTFRQGFGRLIRTQTDRGVVVVLDRRLLTKYYGRAFLDSIPPCTRRQGPLHRLTQVAKAWIDNPPPPQK